MGQPSIYHATVALSFQIEICNLDRTKYSFLATSWYKKVIFTKNWVTRSCRPSDDMSFVLHINEHLWNQCHLLVDILRMQAARRLIIVYTIMFVVFLTGFRQHDQWVSQLCVCHEPQKQICWRGKEIALYIYVFTRMPFWEYVVPFTYLITESNVSVACNEDTNYQFIYFLQPKTT